MAGGCEKPETGEASVSSAGHEAETVMDSEVQMKLVGPLIFLVRENFQKYQDHDRRAAGSSSEGCHDANAEKETVDGHLKINFPSDHIKTLLDVTFYSSSHV